MPQSSRPRLQRRAASRLSPSAAGQRPSPAHGRLVRKATASRDPGRRWQSALLCGAAAGDPEDSCRDIAVAGLFPRHLRHRWGQPSVSWKRSASWGPEGDARRKTPGSQNGVCLRKLRLGSLTGSPVSLPASSPVSRGDTGVRDCPSAVENAAGNVEIQ